MKGFSDLLKRTDILMFEKPPERLHVTDELDIEAAEDNLREVMALVDARLEALGCPFRVQMQIDVAVEEIFVNIAKYAYDSFMGRAKVRLEVEDDPARIAITFIDQGKPYNPLAKEDPDVTLSAADRPIGGLGIFMVKKSMDSVNYEYKDGCNILTLVKNLQ